MPLTHRGRSRPECLIRIRDCLAAQAEALALSTVSALAAICTIRGSYGKERQGSMAMVLNHDSGGLHRSVEMRRRWLLRLLPAGVVTWWGLHPLESAALSRRTR